MQLIPRVRYQIHMLSSSKSSKRGDITETSCHVVFPELVNAEKSGNACSREPVCFIGKQLEKCSTKKPQLLQPKPVMVDPKGTRP